MIHLLFVGDGERDAAVNPPLVRQITGSDVNATTRAWARLNAGKGYGRRLQFAIRQARDEGLQGVVATIDHDKSRGQERLRDLRDGRSKDRHTSAPLPTALGCANPHSEAWLLDDAVAVRASLSLDAKTPIPSVRTTGNPKGLLAALHSQSPRADVPIREILIAIATAIDPRRCQHQDKTGFAAFADDVREEMRPLIVGSARLRS